MRLEPTSDAWVRAALADVATLLLDHAHCERKAAQTALKLMARHADWPALQRALSRLAREELVHFERVLRELHHRGLALRALPAAGYAAALSAAARELPAAPHHGLDELLVCAIIEARSHERFVRLSAATDDARLRKLYGDLLAAEERHGALYVDLAVELAGEPARARLDQLAAREAAVLTRAGQPVRMHAGG